MLTRQIFGIRPRLDFASYQKSSSSLRGLF